MAAAHDHRGVGGRTPAAPAAARGGTMSKTRKPKTTGRKGSGGTAARPRTATPVPDVLPMPDNGKPQPKGADTSPAPLAGFPNLTDHQRRFLVCYSLCGNLTHSAELAGLDRGNHYKWIA